MQLLITDGLSGGICHILTHTSLTAVLPTMPGIALSGKDFFEAAMSHLTDDVDTFQMFLADLLQQLQDVGIALNKQLVRILEAPTDDLVTTQQRDNHGGN